MALCTSPALIDDWAAESLLLNALETPELSIHVVVAAMFAMTAATPTGVAVTATVI